MKLLLLSLVIILVSCYFLRDDDNCVVNKAAHQIVCDHKIIWLPYNPDAK